jgi:hypothetical protein
LEQAAVIYKNYCDVLIDVIDNRWDHNPKSLRGLIQDAIPLAVKDRTNINVRIGEEQIEYNISFIHDQEYQYDWMKQIDFDERDTEYNNIVSNCPAELKEYLHIQARDFWGTTEWYTTRIKDSYNHTQRYEYNLTDKIE